MIKLIGRYNHRRDNVSGVSLAWRDDERVVEALFDLQHNDGALLSLCVVDAAHWSPHDFNQGHWGAKQSLWQTDVTFEYETSREGVEAWNRLRQDPLAALALLAL